MDIQEKETTTPEVPKHLQLVEQLPEKTKHYWSVRLKHPNLQVKGQIVHCISTVPSGRGTLCVMANTTLSKEHPTRWAFRCVEGQGGVLIGMCQDKTISSNNLQWPGNSGNFVVSLAGAIYSNTTEEGGQKTTGLSFTTMDVIQFLYNPIHSYLEVKDPRTGRSARIKVQSQNPKQSYRICAYIWNAKHSVQLM